MSQTPITKEELAQLEALDSERSSLPASIHLSRSDRNEARLVKVVKLLANQVPRLITEIQQLWQNISDLALQASTANIQAANRGTDLERLSNELFGANVEIDNLRKRIEDLRAERDHEREQRDMRHQAWLEGQAMLDAANEREQIQLRIAVEAIKARNGLVAVLKKIREARTKGGCSTGEAMSKIECWAREAIASAAPPPVPMCQDPHPIEKLVDEVIDSQNPT